MARKLLGDRFIGDATFEAGRVLTEEEFAASGLKETDVQTVDDSNVVAPAAAAAVGADKAAELDSAEKNDESASTGSETGASSSSVEDESTVEHTLTEADFEKNPQLTEQGHKVGDVVRIPKE